MSFNRRDFIKTASIASISIIPVARALANSIYQEENSDEDKLGFIEAFTKKPDFHLIDNNLINLHFYFINAEKKANSLRRKTDDRAFMIVRLPQMHLSEEGYFEKIPNYKEYTSSMLSRFSFLAFELGPKKNNEPFKSGEKLIKFNLKYLLDWNSEAFNLITLTKWLQINGEENLKFVENCDIPDKKIIDSKQLNNEGEFSNIFNDKSNINNYKKLVDKFLNENIASQKNNFIPVTLLEAPQGVCLVPINRKESNIRKSARFYKNVLAKDVKKVKGVKKYEVWNNGFVFNREIEKLDDGNQKPLLANLLKTQENFEIQLPKFRVAGVILEKKQKDKIDELFSTLKTNKDDCKIDEISCKEFCEQQGGNEDNFLPSLLDKRDLAFLTQYANDNKGKNFTEPDFDIREDNGLLFTGLGIISHFKYYNLDKLPDEVDLIEYEHKIIQGRDVYIKVARLGYNSKTGQRYKHVIEGKRKIQDKTSFIELKQYCECIDKTIEYFNENSNKYKRITDTNWIKENANILNPVLDKECSFRNFPFRKITIIENKKIPIRCLTGKKIDTSDICELQCNDWFWPTQEKRTTESQLREEIEYNDYLHCEYEGIDWEGNVIKTKSPFIFLRKSYVFKNNLSKVYKDYFLGEKDVNTDKNLLERRKTYFQNQKISYTPLIQKDFENPNGKNTVAEDEEIKRANKTNKLETDFIETYFLIKKKEYLHNIVTQKLVIFPQLLRSKVYLDHVKDITNKKISSVIEYHEDYIEYGFEDYKKEGETLKGNGAKLILANTNAFIDNVEEKANNTYDKIADALAEAKKFTGNLVATNSVYDALSLGKLGASLPKELKEAWKNGKAIIDKADNDLFELQTLDPRELLRGKFKNVCGLDLTQIFDEFIPKGSGPLFEIKNKVNEIGGEVLNSEFYQQVKKSIEEAKRNLEIAKTKYEGSLDKLEEVRLSYNKAIEDLNKEIPNEEDLRNLLNKEFEKLKLKGLEELENLKNTFESSATIKSLNNFKKGLYKYFKSKLKEVCFEAENKYNEFSQLKICESIENPLKQITRITKDSKLENEIRGLLLCEYNRTKIEREFETLFKIKKIDIDGKNYNKVIYEEVEKDIIDTLLKLISNTVKEQNYNDYYLDTKTLKVFRDKNKATPFKNNIVGLKLPSESGNGLKGIGKMHLKKRVEDLNLFLIKNISDSEIEGKLSTTLKKYNAELKRIDKVLDSNTKKYYLQISEIEDELEKVDSQYPKLKSSIAIVRSVFSEIKTALNIVDGLNPEKYIIQFEKYQKELSEIKSRIIKGYLNKYEEDLKKKVDDFYKNEYVKIYVQYIEKIECYFAENDDGNLNYENDNCKLYDTDVSKIKSVKQLKDELNTSIKSKLKKHLDDYLDSFEEVKELKVKIAKAKEEIDKIKKYADDYLIAYENQLKASLESVERRIENEYEDWQEKYKDDISKLKEAERIYKLLKSIKQKDVSFDWNTTNFSNASLGVISFHKQNNPDTQLIVDAKSTIFFKPNIFPPTVDRVETNAVNKFKNFKIGIYNSLFVDFNEISFSSGTNSSSKFDVKIKDVKFEGVLSFVQAFEQYLKTMDTGFIKSIEKDRVMLGYSLPIPSITTPSFNFFNLSLNFGIQIYFDQRSIDFSFSLARKDSMFGLAVGIYAGFGYFAIKANPQDGIIELETALEGGAWAGIRLGPISGEVKLAFGFYFKKTTTSTRLEGYFVAQGRLSVWIIRANAKIYLGIHGQDGNIIGVGYAKLSIKVAFKKKTFSGSTTKVMKRAKSNNNEKRLQKYEKLYNELVKNGILTEEENGWDKCQNKLEESMNDSQNCEVVNKPEWNNFINTF